MITFCKIILFEYLMHVNMNMRRLMSMLCDWFMRPLMAAEARRPLMAAEAV